MEVSSSGDNNIGPSERLFMLEEQELVAPQGQLPPEIYCEFLALYVLHNDINNSKLLWKRIPAQQKTENLELKAVWEICKSFWKRDLSSVFQQCNAFTWSSANKQIIDEIVKRNKENCFLLISRAYTSISVETFAKFINCSVEEARHISLERGWQLTGDKKTILPVRSNKSPGSSLDNKSYMERLTQYISFLETGS